MRLHVHVATCSILDWPSKKSNLKKCKQQQKFHRPHSENNNSQEKRNEEKTNYSIIHILQYIYIFI